jgi:hypothetical protein
MARSASIPEPLRRGFREIATLPEAAFQEFLTALRSLPIEIRQHRVFPDIDLPDLPENGEAIKSATFALVISRADPRISTSQAIDSIAEALSSSDFDHTLLDVFRTRAEAILSVPSLDLIARAHNVLLEHACTYSSARVFSDVRAVFGDDVASEPQAAVIVHMLNITYHSAGRRETIAVALDEKDIDQLIAVLERARTKNTTLTNMIEKSGVRYLRVS